MLAIANLWLVIVQIFLDFYWSLSNLLLSVACKMVSSLMMAASALLIKLNISHLLLSQFRMNASRLLHLPVLIVSVFNFFEWDLCRPQFTCIVCGHRWGRLAANVIDRCRYHGMMREVVLVQCCVLLLFVGDSSLDPVDRTAKLAGLSGWFIVHI